MDKSDSKIVLFQGNFTAGFFQRLNRDTSNQYSNTTAVSTGKIWRLSSKYFRLSAWVMYSAFSKRGVASKSVSGLDHVRQIGANSRKIPSSGFTFSLIILLLLLYTHLYFRFLLIFYQKELHRNHTEQEYLQLLHRLFLIYYPHFQQYLHL